MDRYSGVLGVRFDPIESSPGIWSQPVVEYEVTGDIMILPARWSPGELHQDAIRASHKISILMPDTLVNDFSKIVYISWQGINWVVTGVAPKRPRLELTLGGPYNG